MLHTRIVFLSYTSFKPLDGKQLQATRLQAASSRSTASSFKPLDSKQLQAARPQAASSRSIASSFKLVDNRITNKAHIIWQHLYTAASYTAYIMVHSISQKEDSRETSCILVRNMHTSSQQCYFIS